jgi:outer membrane receptor for ferrienterochelin and colicin
MAQVPSATVSTDVIEVEEVVVSSRTPDLIDQIGVSVSVLDEDTMQSLGYPDLASLLDTQPGVTVTMDGGYGKAAAVRIRGEEGYRTRIVLDGINIADPSSPQVSPRIEHLVSSGLDSSRDPARSARTALGRRCRWRDSHVNRRRHCRVGMEGHLEAGQRRFLSGRLSTAS